MQTREKNKLRVHLGSETTKIQKFLIEWSSTPYSLLNLVLSEQASMDYSTTLHLIHDSLKEKYGS